jgi:predicted GIY-YIG superfamily endonuclease
MDGLVYCLHFARPISTQHTSQHYVGWCRDLDARLRAHRAGLGARLTQVALERDIPFEVVWAVPGTRAFERQIKNRKGVKRYCPICCRMHGVRCRVVAPDARQLVLPLDDDFPEPPRRSMDSYEFLTLRRWRASVPVLTPDLSRLDDLL